MKKIYIYIASAIILTACCGEDYYSYSWAIDNTTDDTLTFILNGESTFNLEEDTIIVIPHHGWIIHSMEVSSSQDVNCSTIFNDLEVKSLVSGNKMLNIDINDESKWENTSFQDGCNNFTYDCLLTIEPEHLTKIEEE